MSPLRSFLKEYTAFFTGLLAHLGIWGPFVIATIDAAAFGIPMDPVIIGYAWQGREQLLLVAFYAITAAAGSALGSLVPYWIGRMGGELLLLKRIDRRKLEDLRDRFEKQEFFFIVIPGLLPPPTPFKLFVLSAGVFEMRVPLFLAAVFTSRVLRFSIVSTMVIIFGPDIVRIAQAVFREHLGIFIAVLLAGILTWILYRRFRRREPQGAVVEYKQEGRG